MKANFEKFFGPQAESAASAVPSFADDMNEAVQRRRVERLTLRRRLLGLAALVLLGLVLGPALFEPDLATADRTALTVIPPMKNVTVAAVVPVRTEVTEETERTAPAQQVDESSVRSAAAALSAANPVSAGMKKAPGVADDRDVPSADPIGALLGRAASAAVSEKSAKPSAGEAAAKDVKPKPVHAARTTEKLPAVSLVGDPKGRWYIQIFATANKAAAEAKAKALQAQGLPSYTESVTRRGTDLWRVRVGRFATRADAKTALDYLALKKESNGGISQLPQEK